jgi:hypothetical protein
MLASCQGRRLFDAWARGRAERRPCRRRIGCRRCGAHLQTDGAPGRAVGWRHRPDHRPLHPRRRRAGPAALKGEQLPAIMQAGRWQTATLGADGAPLADQQGQISMRYAPLVQRQEDPHQRGRFREQRQPYRCPAGRGGLEVSGHVVARSVTPTDRSASATPSADQRQRLARAGSPCALPAPHRISCR